LWLDLQPRDGVGGDSFTRSHADYKAGANTIYAEAAGNRIFCCRPYCPLSRRVSGMPRG
jgi:hypothetical protein